MNRDETGHLLKQQLKSLQVLFIAMIIGIILFALVALIVNNGKESLLKEVQSGNGIMIVAGIISWIVLFAGNRLYQKKISSIQSSDETLQKRLSDYRRALVLFFAFMEFPALLSIICFLLTGEYVFLGWVVIMIVIMLTKFPSENNMINILNISAQEVKSN